ncbi:phosphonate metabolism transcriptional regulator PhnF [Methylococcus sp. ANG]|uniref:phosphonate metabolism transcriptional regulator PhnF n=1 Tax=Methylococcus sp. ANG TaxID=3231903 RepID=UPI0034579BDC
MSLIALNRDGGQAIYSQIAVLLEKEVAHFYNPGDLLPSEKELAERFAVNRHTVRRALDELIAAGLVERRHGKGTFVLDRPIDYTVGKGTRFTETLEALGKAAESRVLRKLIVPARDGVAERLQVPVETPVVWVETLRRVDERPVCVISHFLPQAKFNEVFSEYGSGSLHEFIRRHCGIKLIRKESLVSALLPQGDDASLLGMPLNQPVLRVKSVNVDDRDGTPAEYALTRFRADRIQLRIFP